MLISLSGVLFTQLIVAAFGVLAVTSEFATGTIRSTLCATPRRHAVLAAKAGVLAALILAVGLSSAVASFLVGAAILPAGGFTPEHGYPQLSLADATTLRAIAATGAYLALMALMGLGIGAVARNTGSAVAASLGLILVPFAISAFIGEDAGWLLQKLAPMTAGLSAMSTIPGAPLSPAAGIAVLGAWAGAAMLAALVLTARRDA